MSAWLAWTRDILLRKTNLPALLACLVVVAGWIVAETQARSNQIEAQRSELAAQVALLRANLESTVNGPIQLVRGLIAVIETEPEMDQLRFSELARRIIKNEPLLRNIAAAPNMIIEMMYPIEGNQQAIGLDYNSIAAQRDAAVRARDLGDLVLAGPVDLVQGGHGFIGRFPVFVSDNDDETPVFWGLVSAVIDRDVLYEQLGLRDDLPFSVTIAGRDATGADGQRFFGPEVRQEDLPVAASVQLPTGTWEISALPHGGWNTQHPKIWTIRALLLMAAAMILVPSIQMGRSMEARQRAIEELESVNNDLKRKMHDLETARAAHAEAELQLRQSQKLEAVGQLTGGVAHDFNNLLTVILGNSEMLMQTLPKQSDTHNLAEMILGAAERGAELTSRLLSFSRKQPLKPVALNINKQIGSRLELLLRRTLPGTISLQIKRAENLWSIEVDPSQLESALLNLVLNARDAMPHGGLIQIETKNASLDENFILKNKDFEAGEYVTISVNDSGKGMTEPVRLQAFEPFFTTKEVGSGSGLGLSMVYGFMKQSGGHVAIKSAPERGTSVVLFFPRSQSKIVRSDTYSPFHVSARGWEKVLVVEDDPWVRTQVRANLIGLGYRVVEAENGATAISIIEQEGDIDLLFTDIVLPGGINGRVLADAAKLIRPNLKILFTSGYTEDAINQHGRLDPDVELLSKPYRHAQLARKLRKILE